MPQASLFFYRRKYRCHPGFRRFSQSLLSLIFTSAAAAAFRSPFIPTLLHSLGGIGWSSCSHLFPNNQFSQSRRYKYSDCTGISIRKDPEGRHRLSWLGVASNTDKTRGSTITTWAKMDFTTWSAGHALAVPKCVIPLSFDSHKGSSGRVGVLGGSAQYTGAPYYAAMASLKAGADLAYVFCAEEAALPIKSYSPELMVAPVYSSQEFDRYSNEKSDSSCQHDEEAKEELVQSMVDKVKSKIDNLHALVVGPGLGRCPLVCEAAARILKYAKSQHLALIIDADGLWLLSQPQYRSLWQETSDDPKQIMVLTPNVVEYKGLFAGDSNCNNGTSNNNPSVTIVKKGQTDAILRGQEQLLTCEETGGKKRSGGIGDVLAGTLGTLVSWHVILQGRAEGSTEQTDQSDLPLSCWTACCFVKRATKIAFEANGRSMTAPDVLDHLGPAINKMTSDVDFQSNQ